jgi:hypothetical protein
MPDEPAASHFLLLRISGHPDKTGHSTRGFIATMRKKTAWIADAAILAAADIADTQGLKTHTRQLV